ncbi:MAG: ribose-5-phosphate isomerase A, partial [Methanosarcinales archaeon]|nr:ribose-5-phosphate isomerase A [Methanosarcinales archaeon]
PVVTDNGNFVIDADFGEIEDPALLNREINATIGVVEHGIFLNVDEVHIGTMGGVKILEK